MLKTSATVAATVLFLMAGACSSDSDDAATSTTSTTVATGSAAVLPPTIVDGAEDVTVDIGHFVVVSTADATRVETSDTAVLEVSQAYSDGSAEFNAGAEALEAGSAVLTVYNGDEALYEVNVTVEG